MFYIIQTQLGVLYSPANATELISRVTFPIFCEETLPKRELHKNTYYGALLKAPQ